MTPHVVRCALFGLGRWGANYLRTIPRLSALELRAAWDPSQAARDAAATLAPSLSFEPDFEQLYANEVQAVVIATPTPQHASMAVSAIRAGLHVLVEKPLALSPAEAETVLAEAERHERMVLVGQLTQHHPGIARLRELVSTGRLGGIRRVVATRTSNGARHHAERALWSLGPHDVSNVLAVFSDERSFIVERASEPNLDEADLAARYGDVEVSMRWSRRSPHTRRTLLVSGRTGEAELDEVSGKLSVRLSGGAWDEPHAPQRPLLEEQCRHFAACILGQENPRPTLTSAARVVSLLHEAARIAGTRDTHAPASAPA